MNDDDIDPTRMKTVKCQVANGTSVKQTNQDKANEMN